MVLSATGLNGLPLVSWVLASYSQSRIVLFSQVIYTRDYFQRIPYVILQKENSKHSSEYISATGLNGLPLVSWVLASYSQSRIVLFSQVIYTRDYFQRIPYVILQKENSKHSSEYISATGLNGLPLVSWVLASYSQYCIVLFAQAIATLEIICR